MPVYDYKCQQHGLFYELETISNSGLPKACPHCGAMSPRVIILPPEFSQLNSEKNIAHAVNEKNQHEPTFSTQERREHDHQHGSGCGCSKKRVSKPKMMLTANGEKIFPTMRPWMISH